MMKILFFFSGRYSRIFGSEFTPFSGSDRIESLINEIIIHKGKNKIKSSVACNLAKKVARADCPKPPHKEKSTLRVAFEKFSFDPYAVNRSYNGDQFYSDRVQ